MSLIKITDAQIHPWAQGKSTGHHRRLPITEAVLMDEMAAAGVAQALLVPPLWDPGGNAYALAMAARQPERFAVMGLLPEAASLAPEAGRERLAKWRETPSMVGLRFLFNTPERLTPYLEGRYDWVWPSAEAAGLVLALLVPNALTIAAEIAERHPDLKVIVDHLGVPRGARGLDAFLHLDALLALARFPNLFVKAVGVGDYAQDPYPFRSLDIPLRRVFDSFGPERVIWGSDLSRIHHPYRDCVAHFAEALPWLTPDERSLVMGGNLRRLTGWTTKENTT